MRLSSKKSGYTLVPVHNHVNGKNKIGLQQVKYESFMVTGR